MVHKAMPLKTTVTETNETLVGRVTSVFGIKGWVKVFSYTEVPENILRYADWRLQDDQGFSGQVKVLEGKRHGKALVVRLVGVDDCDQARRFCSKDIWISSELLDPLDEGDYYWYQLEGLAVETLAGEHLGIVHHLMETGANDVLVVRGDAGSIDQRERLIPYLYGQVVKEVSLELQRLVVDWAVDF